MLQLLFFFLLLMQNTDSQGVQVASLLKIGASTGGFTGVLSSQNSFGQSLSLAPDINGDAINDIIVGASGIDATYIVFQTSSASVKSFQKLASGTGSFTGTSLTSGDNFGCSTTFLSTPRAVVVGANFDDDGSTDNGAIYLIYLRTNGTSVSHQKISDTKGSFTATFGGDYFGTAIASFDVNGDNVLEVAVGATKNGSNNVGCLYILFLTGTGTVSSFKRYFEQGVGSFTASLNSEARFGSSIASMFINSDTIPDVAVGAAENDDGGDKRGAVYVIFFQTTSSLPVSSFKKISDLTGGFTAALANGDRLGGSIASLGDLNYDNNVDILVGATRDDDGVTDTGSVFILFLTTTGDVRSFSKISQLASVITATLATNSYFGSALTVFSDIDGNGFPDMQVGVPGGGYFFCLFLGFSCPPISVQNSNFAQANSITGFTGQSKSVVCNAGYSGGGIATCGTTGTFNTLLCTAVSCPSSSSGTNVPAGCTCNNGYSGSISPISSSPYYSGSCTAVACPSHSAGTNLPSGCSCNAGYSGTITLTNTSPYYTGSCVAVACPVSSSGASVGAGCVCNAGYSGTISATTSSPYFSGVCVAVVCPTGSAGTNLPSGCSCNAGYSGTISATTSSPYFSGACVAVACPTSSAGTNLPSGCSCNAGYSGTISATTSSPYFSGACVAVACPPNSTGSNVPSGCSCDALHVGLVNPTTTSPFYNSTCEADLDECSTNICPSGSICENLIGSYQCFPYIGTNSLLANLRSMGGGEQIIFELIFPGPLSAFSFGSAINNSYTLSLSYGREENRWFVPPESTQVDLLAGSENPRYRVTFNTVCGYGKDLSVILRWAWTDSVVPAPSTPKSGFIASQEVFSYPIPTIEKGTLRLNSSLVPEFADLGTVLSDVTITGTAGQFFCSSTALVVGATITISGQLGGTGTIAGYANPSTYYIITTDGSTNFTLSTTPSGSGVPTTTGTPTGLIYSYRDSPSYIYSFSNEYVWLTFFGSFGCFDDQVTITYSTTSSNSTLYRCLLSDQEGRLGNIRSDSITCRTEGAGEAGSLDYVFTVKVGLIDGQHSLPGEDYVRIPSLPDITNVTGCTDLEVGTMDCPTVGSVPITVFGTNFEPQMKVFVGSSECNLVLQLPNRLSCTLPAGVGLKVAIVVQLQNMISYPKYYLSYAGPKVTSLYHVNCNNTYPNSLEISHCPRLGGGSLVIGGTDFWSKDAVVLVGAAICTNVTHIASGSGIACNLPSGSSLNQKIIIVQSGGAIYVGDAIVNYDLCEAGKHLNITSLDCGACASGKYSSIEGSTACLDCGPGKYSLTGVSACSDCRIGTYQSSSGNSDCSDCEPGRFNSIAGRPECTYCVPGRYQDNTESSDCFDCLAGYYSNVAGLSECVMCPVGKFTSNSTQKLLCESCQIGRYQNETAETDCKPCNAGKYSVLTANSYCSDCAPGTFADRSGAIECELCEAGKFQRNPSRSSCELCESGKYQNDLNETECKFCPSGKYSSVRGLAACLDCDAGKYNSIESQTKCLDCENGRFKNVTSDATCEDCTAGKYTSDSTTHYICIECLPGRFQDASGKENCTFCPQGFFQNLPGMSSCVLCSSGRYAASAGLTECLDCDTGKFKNSTGAGDCIGCAAGKFNKNSGVTICQNCNKGTFSPVSGMGDCLHCDPGSFQSEVGSTICDKCTEGTFQSAGGATVCDACNPGKYSSEGANGCDECDSPFLFQPLPGASNCVSCPVNGVATEQHRNCFCKALYYAVPHGATLPGNSTPCSGLMYCDLDYEGYTEYVKHNNDFNLTACNSSISSISIINCDPNEFLNFDCVKCPEGANCDSDGTSWENVRPIEDYFIGLPSQWSNNSIPTQFFNCFNDIACNGTNCSTGYTGHYCTECVTDGAFAILDDNYYCKSCPPFEVEVVIVVIMVIFLLVLMYFYVQNKRKGDKPQMHGVWFKIILAAFQVNSIALRTFDFDPLLQVWFNIASDTASLGSSYLRVACLRVVSSPYIVETTMYLFGPILCIITSACGAYIIARKSGGGHAVALREAWSVSIGIGGAIMFLLYPTLVERSADLLYCQQLGRAPEDLFLARDLSIRCWTSAQHKRILWGLFAPMTLLYTIAWPASVAYLLMDNRKTVLRINQVIRRDDDDSLMMRELSRTFGSKATASRQSFSSSPSCPTLDESESRFHINFSFLFLGYKNKSFYWEVTMILRKTVLFIFGVAFQWNLRLQGVLCLLVLFTSTLLHARRLPYVIDIMNHLEFLSLIVTSITFFLGLLTIEVPDAKPEYIQGITAISFIINMTFAVVAFVFLFISIKTLVDTARLEKERVESQTKLATINQPLSLERDSTAVDGIELGDLNKTLDDIDKSQEAPGPSTSMSTSSRTNKLFASFR